MCLFRKARVHDAAHLCILVDKNLVGLQCYSCGYVRKMLDLKLHFIISSTCIIKCHKGDL